MTSQEDLTADKDADDKESAITNSYGDQATSICCTCGFGRSARARSHDLRTTSGVRGSRNKPSLALSSRTVYHDVELGGSIHIEDKDLVFFDALYEFDGSTKEEDYYPIITRSYIPARPAQDPSMEEPCTMMAKEDDINNMKKDTVVDSVFVGSDPGGEPKKLLRMISRGRSSVLKQGLQQNRLEIVERGYPGQLNRDEMDKCMDFFNEIHKRGGAYLDIVYSYKDFEEEPYTICRFMRGAHFKTDTLLEQIEGDIPAWEETKRNNFYCNIEDVTGITQDVFLHMFPITGYGFARNGSPVEYIQVGKMDPEGMFSMCSMEDLEHFFWHHCHNEDREQFRLASSKYPDFVRCEKITVFDLEGFSSSQLTSEIMQFIQKADKIGDCYPETLLCVLVLNAPSWFSISWRIIRNFLPARTSMKFEVYSKKSVGVKRLKELIELTQLPADYGGAAPNIHTLIRNTGSKDDSNNDESLDNNRQPRRAIKSIFVKQDKKKTLSNVTSVNKGEIISIRVYTRSIHGAEVSVYLDQKDDNTVETLVNKYRIARTGTTPFEATDPHPKYSIEILSSVVPADGTLSFQIHGLTDVSPLPRKISHGHFVIVASMEESP